MNDLNDRYGFNAWTINYLEKYLIIVFGIGDKTALLPRKKMIVKTLGSPSCHANAGALESPVGGSD
jgi:hypothetical protein